MVTQLAPEVYMASKGYGIGNKHEMPRSVCSEILSVALLALAAVTRTPRARLAAFLACPDKRLVLEGIAGDEVFLR